MAIVNFPELEPEEYKGLVDKGYWYFKTYRRPLGFIYKPLHRKAALLMKFFYIYPIIIFVSMFVLQPIRELRTEKPYLALALIFVPVLLPRLLLWGKVYNAVRKDYLAVNKGKRDGLYTSAESLYTTDLEGTFICQTCSTPVASTDDKLSAQKPRLTVSKLFDKNLVDIKDGRLICISCQTDLGEVMNDVYQLDGEKLALNADELHLIYP